MTRGATSLPLRPTSLLLVATLTSIPELAAAVPVSAERIIVGIAGPPGSGKSTIAAALVEALGPKAAQLGMDGWHYPQSRLLELGRRDRMGAADTFDVDAFVATIESLRADDGTVVAPGFDRHVEEPVPDAIVVTPETCIVVVEGNYLLHDSGGWERVAPLLDATFFVELEQGIRLQRLIERHVRFGKTAAEASAWANGPDETNSRLVAGGASRAGHALRLG